MRAKLVASKDRNKTHIVDPQDILSAAFSIILLMVGGITKTLWDAVQRLRSDLTALERELPAQYVHKDDYREDMQDIKSLLVRIDDKLDGKADK